MDWAGIALLWTTLIALQFVLEEGQAHDWFQGDLIVVGTLVAGFGAIAFLIRELTAPAPAVNLRLFADRAFATGTLVNATVMAVLISGMFLLPLFMQEMLGLSATTAGIALIPRTLVMLVAMPFVGKSYARFPPALVTGLGLLAATVGQYTLARLTLDSTQRDVLIGIMLQGLGMSTMLVPLSTLSLTPVPRTQLADATGLSSLLRQLGASLGLAAMSTMLSRYAVLATKPLKWQIVADRPEVMARLARGRAPGRPSAD